MDDNVRLILIAVITSPVIMVIANVAVRRWEKRGELRDKREEARVVREELRLARIEVEKARWASMEQQDAHAKAVQDSIQDVKNVVSSNIASAEQDLLDASVHQLAYLQELIDTKQASGTEPSPEALAALNALKLKVEHLKENVAAKQAEAQRAALAKAARQKEDMFDGGLEKVLALAV